MGKRKSKRKAPTKAKAVQPLDKQFNCPFCNHERSCEVKLDRDRNVGFVSCRVCLEDFQTSINYLSEEIDVYSDWIDACEQANHLGLIMNDGGPYNNPQYPQPYGYPQQPSPVSNTPN
uniref:Transcription elongation factor 1 homolog n=1 Tax=Romanomermis culicivorax TaxID=13658 RepID=A0A915JLR9_ROMCU